MCYGLMAYRASHTRKQKKILKILFTKKINKIKARFMGSEIENHSILIHSQSVWLCRPFLGSHDWNSTKSNKNWLTGREKMCELCFRASAFKCFFFDALLFVHFIFLNVLLSLWPYFIVFLYIKFHDCRSLDFYIRSTGGKRQIRIYIVHCVCWILS